MEKGGIEDVVHRVAKILEKLKANYAIGGMLAGAIHGYPVATFDVDVSVGVSEEGWKRVVRAFLRGGFTSGERPAVHELGTALLKTPGGWNVDLFLETDREVFERAVKVEYHGRPIRFLSLEDLLRYKLEFRRMKDIAHIIGLLRVNKDRIDWEYLKRKLDPEELEYLERLRDVAWGRRGATALFG